MRRSRDDQVDLEVTLPGEGKDRVFRVSIRWVAQVSLYALEEALEGRVQHIPYEAIQVTSAIEVPVCLSVSVCPSAIELFLCFWVSVSVRH